MGDTTVKADVAKNKLLRCLDWLQKQNSDEPKKLSLQNKNDIQFIIQTNAARKSFLLAAAEDEATVPAGVDEYNVEPKPVSRYKLRVENLNIECEWQSCKMFFKNYEVYQKHVGNHVNDLHIIGTETGTEFVCLWDICGHKTSDFQEMTRHINYHAYHGKLLAIGYNGRATLKLLRCKKDSSKRNQLPLQNMDYCCMWVGCELTFSSMQSFLDHVKFHTSYTEPYPCHTCSWGGCGTRFPKKEMLVVHIRSHTNERLIACYHCGQHFANNRKLSDHLRRQNVYSTSPFVCDLCGTRCATEYLLNEHIRQHVSTYACTLCDMSATSPAALAHHVRYRHLTGKHARPHACPHCTYRAVTKWDLRRHITTHKRKNKLKESSDKDVSDEENSENETKPKKKKSVKQFACHLCPEKEMKVFSRGSRLTIHLVKIHGAQWSFGHSRFRYQLCKDGMHRLTTTRLESLEVSTKIVDEYTGPKELSNFEFKLEQVAEPSETTPRRFEVTLKKEEDENVAVSEDDDPVDKKVEITMCDVDDKGNILTSEVIKSEYVYT